METLHNLLIAKLNIPLAGNELSMPIWILLLMLVLILLIKFILIDLIIPYYLANKDGQFYFIEYRLPYIVKEEIEESIEKMRSVFSQLWDLIKDNKHTISMELFKTDKYIAMQVGSNNKETLEASKAILAKIRNSSPEIIERDNLSLIKPNWKVYSVKSNKDFYTVQRDQHFFDGVINYLSKLKYNPKSEEETEQAVFQFIFRGVKKQRQIEGIKKHIEKRANKEERTLNESEKKRWEMFNLKGSSNLFRVQINLISHSRQQINEMFSLFSSLNLDKNIFTKKEEKRKNAVYRLIPPETWLQKVFRTGSYLNAEELSYMIHPSDSLRGVYAPYQLKIIEASPEFLQKRDDNILIGYSKTAEGKRTPVYFPIDKFVRHIYIIGMTGRGKSTFMQTMLLDLLQKQDKTFFVFDPHGDMLKEIICLTDKKEKIKYFNINEKDKIYTFNPLFCFEKSEEWKVSIKDTIVNIIRNETHDNSDSMSNTGIATLNRIHHLIEIGTEFADAYYNFLIQKGGFSPEKARKTVNERQITLNDITSFLKPEFTYIKLLKEVFKYSNNQTAIYIERELESHSRQQMVTIAVQTRLDAILQYPAIRYIVEGNNFDFFKQIESNQMFLFPMQKSVFGDIGMRTITQLIFSMAWLIKRSKDKDRKDTYFFIDEFQNAQVHTIPDILSEARKFKLYLMLAHQHFGQLRTEIIDAILGNAGTLVSFTLSPDNAERIAKQYGGKVSDSDVVNLPKYNAYLRTEGDKNKPLATFGFTTVQLPQVDLSSEKASDTLEEINNSTLDEFGDKKADMKAKLEAKQKDAFKYFITDVLK